MSRFVFTCLLLLSAANLLGQKTVRLVDGQTMNAVARVEVADSLQILGETGADGTITLAEQQGSIIFAHELYERVKISYESLPDTIVLTRAFLTLPEVVVVGNEMKKIDPGIFAPPTMTLDMKLAAIQVQSGINLLGPIVYGVSKLIPSKKSRKESKLQRLERALDEATRP